MIERRTIVAALACGLTHGRASAKAPAMAQICFMSLATRVVDGASVDAFRDGLSKLGHVEGKSYRLLWLSSDGDVERAAATLREQLKMQPIDVFLAPGPASARLVLRATQQTPIVAVGLHPRGGQTDLFASLARPGGRVTGLSNFGEELATKRVQLLKEAMPRLTHVGVLHNVAEPVFRRWGEETAMEVRAQGLKATQLPMNSPSLPGLMDLMRGARRQGVEALVIVRDFLTATLYETIAHASRDIGLACMAEERRFPDAGALMSYGVNDADLFRAAARYVDRILKGVAAADLPIEQPNRFELVINQKAARALGLALPQSLLLRADEVIK